MAGETIVLLGDPPLEMIRLADLLRSQLYNVIQIHDPHELVNRLSAGFLSHAGLVCLDYSTRQRASNLAFKLSIDRDLIRSTPLCVVFHPMQAGSVPAMRTMGVERFIFSHSRPEEVLERLNTFLYRGPGTRRHLRVPAYLPIECRMEGETYFARTSSLSAGGVFVQITPPLPRGHKVDFRLKLDGERTVSGEGRVVYEVQREPIGGILFLSGFGLRFDEVPEDDREAVLAYVEARARETVARETEPPDPFSEEATGIE